MIWELKTIDKNNLLEIASYFNENHSTGDILKLYSITQDNGYGTLFLESKMDDTIKFSIHKDEHDPNNFSSITFWRINISIAELINLYPIYHRGYIAYDDEYGYVFKSISKNYMIEAFVNGKYNEETDMKLLNLLRLTVKW